MKRYFFLWPLLLMLGACDGGSSAVSGQVLARVNGQDVSVHQLNRLISQRPVDTPQQRTELVEGLIRRELAVQQAMAQKLDRQPDVMLRLEEARRDVLAAVWAERLETGQGVPDRNEVARYFAAHPGLFAERKLYRLREFTLTADDAQLAEAQSRISKAQSLAELKAWLQERKLSMSEKNSVRMAEQLPVEVVDRLHQVRPGQTTVFRLSRSLVIYELQSAESMPVSWTEAEPVIRAHLMARARTQAMEKTMQALRSQTRIEYGAAMAPP